MNPQDTALQAPLNIGSRLEPLVDRYLIESLTNTRHVLHQPQPAGVAVRFDSPWDGRFSGVITVLHDGPDYHMFYRGKPDATEDGEAEVTCYAHSTNGIDWVKPNLGRVASHGSTNNNIVLDDTLISAHNFCPFIDDNPATPVDQRFKGIAGLHPHGLFALVSPDAVNWTRLQDAPIITCDEFAFDSQNVAFWSQSENCYIVYFRTWKEHPSGDPALGYRWISRATSPDFIHWSAPVEMETGDAPLEHLYTNQTRPYYRAPHIYISLAARFWPGKRVVSKERADELQVDNAYSNDCSDGVLMTSRGGNSFDRTFMESFIRPGIGDGNWISRTNYPGLGIIQTGPAEMSLFAHREYAQPTVHASRMTLRLDGFASVNAPYSGGEMRTHALTFEGSALVINYSTSAAGSVRVEIQDEAGQVIPGYGLGDCIEIVGDEVERVVCWQHGSDVSSLAEKPVRLRFVMHDADLYSLQFRELI